MRLNNLVAVVTGAAAGIGLACAQRFATEGAKVMLADIDHDRGTAAAEALTNGGLDAAFTLCDVGDKGQIDNLIAATVKAFGRIDCAVANAGIVIASDFLDLKEEDFDHVIRTNLKGVFLIGQAAARQMVAQRSGDDEPGQPAGTIINMSSVNAVLAIPNIAAYVAAKGGVNQLTKAMALSLVDKGIRVNAIGPGSVQTDVFEAVANDTPALTKVLSRTPMGRVAEPDEIARVAVFLASEDSSYITGQTIYPDGGRLALNYTVPVPNLG